MKVFKFGGASVKDANAVRNVANILSTFNGDKILMIVSAMGKTTNALEKVCYDFYHDTLSQNESLKTLIDFHENILNNLFPNGNPLIAELRNEWNDIPNIIQNNHEQGYDFVYDQIVSLGEWASTRIVSEYLSTNHIENHWIDAADCIKTDATYREGRIQWDETLNKCNEILTPLLDQSKLIITQGFTGMCPEGFITTLGREGSDYSAAIFSYCLNADSMTVWKDVPGILNADPRKFSNVTKLEKISYREAIEMTYYGASVIHPKTIKPLQNKNIPLFVKSFVKPEADGTVISTLEEENYPPIVMVETHQNLLHISTKDFSFVAEHHLSDLFASFAKCRIKVNMMRNTAISFYACVTHKTERLDVLLDTLKSNFKVERTEDLELITIRYHNNEIINKLKEGKIVLLEERLKNTLQMVVKNVPIPERIK